MKQENGEITTCYSCGRPGIEDEHVPPRCIFPKDKRYRINLLTVPSCPKHNTKKSKNDELLRHFLVTAPQTNELAIKVLEESVLPSFERRPHILETFLPNLTPVRTRLGESASYRMDVKRFESSVGAMVRALYYLEHHVRLHAKLNVVWGALITADHSKMPFHAITEQARRTLPPIDKGDNPRVFKYAINASRDGTTFVCRLQFYEGIPIIVTWENGPPFSKKNS